MAYQFIHIETYSEARTKVKGTTDHYNSAAQVMGEAMREPNYSKHVEAPGKVWHLAGTLSVRELQRKRALILSNLKETVSRKNGTTYERRLRNDAATLYTEIHSHPLPANDYLNAPHRHHPDIGKWSDLALTNFKSRMPAGIDWSAVMHLDESHVHFHILAINTTDPKLDANKLHAGKMAAARLRVELDAPTAITSLPRPELQKRPKKPKQPRPSKNRDTQRKNSIKRTAQLAAWKSECIEIEQSNAEKMKKWEERNKGHLQAARLTRGAIPEKQAFTDAMKNLQDSYYEAVGKPCGLLRDGPRNTRLSTVEYDQRKQSARVIALDLNQATQAVQQASAIKEDYLKKAAALAAEKAEFDEGVKATETLVTQLETGQATISNGAVQIQNPPAFIQRLFKRKPAETHSTGIFRRLFKLIIRGNDAVKTGSQTLEP